MPEPASIALFGTGCVGLAVRYLQMKYQAAKPYVEWAVALLLLLLTAPLIGACALLVKLTSKGPAFYKQERVGLNGLTFMLLKLRTMRHDAEALTGPVWAEGDDDPRVAPFGRFLRRMHIDELPQLVNVLRGEMSLVGPRPERPHFVNELKGQIHDYERRLSVRPGITGLAQVRAGYDRTLRDVQRKVRLDCLYIRRMCWWVDFVIILRTVGRVLTPGSERRGARSEKTAVRAT
jgi:lipopolysaccharide/colanic/teichoic acid biosynthesis glycosyltransferase